MQKPHIDKIEITDRIEEAIRIACSMRSTINALRGVDSGPLLAAGLSNQLDALEAVRAMLR